MTLAAYQGRKFDLLSLRSGPVGMNYQLDQTLFDTTVNGQVCTGIQKLAQRWVLEFMTVRGSMPFHMANRGTDFMREVRQGQIQSELDVESIFKFAAIQIKQNFLLEDKEDDPLDERIDIAHLLEINIGPGYLSLKVMLQSLAGDQREVILPISFTPVNVEL